MSGASRRIAFVAVALPLLLLVVIALFFFAQPTSFSITRTRTIAASPARVMAHLTDLRAFEAWDPWPAEPGRTPVVTYSLVSSGLGAWVDRRDARGGARTTIRSITDETVVMTNETSGALGGNVSTQTFTVRPHGTGTEVSWRFGAGLHGLARLLYPFVHVEARLGPEMDVALDRLDRAVTR